MNNVTVAINTEAVIKEKKNLLLYFCPTDARHH